MLIDSQIRRAVWLAGILYPTIHSLQLSTEDKGLKQLLQVLLDRLDSYGGHGEPLKEKLKQMDLNGISLYTSTLQGISSTTGYISQTIFPDRRSTRRRDPYWKVEDPT